MFKRQVWIADLLLGGKMQKKQSEIGARDTI